MNVYSILGIATTVLTFVAFLGIVAWAYGSGRRQAFDEAANAPFALPDEADEISGDHSRRAGRPVMSAVGPSQGANSAPSGGSVAARAASVEAHK